MTCASVAQILEHLEDRCLLTPPSLADIEPNVGTFITQGTVLNESPQELTFKFSPGQTITQVTSVTTNVTTVPGISIARAAATATTDFGTNGAAVLDLNAQAIGSSGNGVQLLLTKKDLGSGANVRPLVTVVGSTVSVVLNTNAARRTTAQGLADAINTDAAANLVLAATVRTGAAVDVTTPTRMGTLLTLSGANANTAVSDFNAGAPLQVQLTAVVSAESAAGQGLSLVVLKDGAVGVPTVSVIGQTINVTMHNSAANSAANKSAQALVDAINQDAAASALVVASIPVGNASTDVANSVINPTTVQLASPIFTAIAPGSLQRGSVGNEVVFRFASKPVDDFYRITISETGSTPLTNSLGEVFNNGGSDFVVDFSVDSGAQVVAVVPQPVLRSQVLTAPTGANLRVGDTLTLSAGGNPVTFEFVTTAGARSNFNYQEIVFSAANSAATVATNIAAAINSYRLNNASPMLLPVDAVAAGANVTISPHEGPGLTADQYAPVTPSVSFETPRTGGSAVSVFTLQDAPAPTSLQQAFNLVAVYFNNDPLDATRAANPSFYKLIDVATGAVLQPVSVNYSSTTNLSTLLFPNGALSGGTTYRLQVGGAVTQTNTTASATNVGRLYSNTGGYTGSSYLGAFGTNGGADDVQLYAISIASGQTITATASNQATGLTTWLRIFDSTGAEQGSPGANTATYAAPAAGTFYIGVSSGANTSYTITGAGGGAAGGTGVGNYQLNIAVSGAGSSVTIPTGGNHTSFQGNGSTDLGAIQLGVLGAAGQSITNAQISPVAGFPLYPFPGGNDEPGHRDLGQLNISGESNDGSTGQTPTAPSAIPVFDYWFPDSTISYGTDPTSGALLYSQITPEQIRLAQQIFEIYGYYLGIIFRDTTNDAVPSGTRVVTGDPRANDSTIPPTIGGISGDPIIMNATLNIGTAQFGGSWFGVAFHEIGHTAMLLAHSYDLPSVMGQGLGGVSESGTVVNTNVEPVFPGDVNLVPAMRSRPPNATDVNVYRFQLSQPGTFSATTLAEQAGGPAGSLLDTVLTVYEELTVAASLTTDFQSGNAVRVKFSAAAVGTGGNALSVRVVKGDYGAVPYGSTPATIPSYAGNVLTVPLNINSSSNGIFRTTAQDVVDAVNLLAGSITASIDAGINTTAIAATALNNVTLPLTGGGTSRQIVAQNDNYFGKDSHVSLHLEAGTYYVTVTSVGNINFDPTIPFSGFGGRTDGRYNLNLEFTPDVPATTTQFLTDLGGQPLDGAGDGSPGDAFNFWFKAEADSGSGSGASTLYVDKNSSETGPGALGSITNAYSTLASAVSAATAGTIIRVEGNGNVFAVTNNLLQSSSSIGVTPYLLGYDSLNSGQIDGSTLKLPKDVTLQIDAGAVFKTRSAIIDAGSSAPGIDRSGGTLQVLGTPTTPVRFTSLRDNTIGGQADPSTSSAAAAGDWGGIVLRSDSDYGAGLGVDTNGDRVFVNSVNHANVMYGGGQVTDNAVLQVFNPVHLVGTRPTVSYNNIVKSADAAISADPNSFDDRGGRTGPDVHGNHLVGNATNGLFVRIAFNSGTPLDTLQVPARFKSTDIVYVISQSLVIAGNPANSTSTAGSLVIDPGVVVKLAGSRIEAEIGGASLIAEGTAQRPIVFTSLNDNRYGAGGTFYTSNSSLTNPVRGDWGGIFVNSTSSVSVDHAVISYGGGYTPIEGFSDKFNAVTVQQGQLRLTNSLLENNDDGAGGNRNGRLSSDAATIFVRGAQPVIVNNQIINNIGAAVSVNTNALQSRVVSDWGRSTSTRDAYSEYRDNHGPLVRQNVLDGNTVNGMRVRGEQVTTDLIWDDTDVVHVVESQIAVTLNVHTYGTVRLQSSSDASLVVKLQGATAGFISNGVPTDIHDRIGGTLQIVGTPGHSVVLTSLSDSTVGAGLNLQGLPQNATNNNPASTGSPGDWGSVTLDRYSNDRNVGVANESETLTSGDTNGILTSLNNTSQVLGTLATNSPTAAAPHQNGGNDDQPLGFEVHGALYSPFDVDYYSFAGTAGQRVWLDIGKTTPGLATRLSLVDGGGNSLASAFVNDAGVIQFTGIAQALDQTPTITGDGHFYTTNTRDPAMSLLLPGAGTGSYFVKVESYDDGSGNLRTQGTYQLQIRSQQLYEHPGVTIRYSDIRFATNGIEVFGLPNHSPLTGESASYSGSASSFGNAQYLGNLLTSDRATIDVSGQLNAQDSVDWYSFTLDYDLIQVIVPAARTAPVAIHIGYADGIVRPNTTMSIFDGNGRLIYVSRDSNITDAQTANGGTSAGPGDPFLGPVQLPAGESSSLNTGVSGSSPGSAPVSFTYYVAISTDKYLPTAINATIAPGSGSHATRLEPVGSVKRIVDDHIGYTGYTTGSSSTTSHVAPVSGPILDISTSTAVDSVVQAFTLSDVVLYVGSNSSTAQNTGVNSVNPFTGQFQTHVSGSTSDDIAMRSDGTLYSYVSDPATPPTNGGLLNTINTATGAATLVAGDNVNSDANSGVPDPNAPPNHFISGLSGVDALAWTGDTSGGNDYRLFFTVRAGSGSKLFEATPDGSLRFVQGATVPQVIPAAPADTNIRTTSGPALSGRVTGMAFIGGTLFGVSSGGQFFTIDTTTAVATIRSSGWGILQGLARGPQNVEGGAYANMLFAITSTGTLRAFDSTDLTGTPQAIFTGGATSASVTGIPAITGLAFSPLDFNLWHPTTSRGRDVNGPGIVGGIVVGNAAIPPGGTAPDNSRNYNDLGTGTPYLHNIGPDGREVSESTGADTGAGGGSFYFGFEQYRQFHFVNSTDYFDYGNGGQFGVVDSQAYQDLSTTISDTTINLPGGAYGDLVTAPFDLSSMSGQDKPTLYFNYFLETRNDGGTKDPTKDFRDSARVWATADGVNWIQLATNNSLLSTPTAPGDAELPTFRSVMSNASSDGNQNVQELYDNTGNWMQARIDLSSALNFWGSANANNIRLRFSFSTAGKTAQEAADEAAGRLLTAGGSAIAGTFGALRDVETGFFGGASNRDSGLDHEGWYVTDIIVAATERGEMVTSAAVDQSFFGAELNEEVKPPPQPKVVQSGAYQLEIRPSTKYGSSASKQSPELVVSNHNYGTNTRFIPDTSVGTGTVGDQTIIRQQGRVQIYGNTISDFSVAGIVLGEGTRDGQTAIGNANLPHGGAIRNTNVLNNDSTLGPSLPGGSRVGIAPGVQVMNNVIYNIGTVGIDIQGVTQLDPTTGAFTAPLSTVPYHRVVNNTIYGGATRTGVGIQVGVATNPGAGPATVPGYAAPTMMNNLVTNTVTGISVSATSPASIVGTTTFQNNGTDTTGITATNTRVITYATAADSIFIGPSVGNFYLKENVDAIDSSLNTLADRPGIVAVQASLSIPQANLTAPNYDRYGQLRVADSFKTIPPPPGVGTNPFIDRGAVERSDFVGPTAALTEPLDGSANDLDPSPFKVLLADPGFVAEFVVKLSDLGISIDNTTVTSSAFRVFRLDYSATVDSVETQLTDGVDYVFKYNSNTHEVIFTAASSFDVGHRYRIVLDNTVISDLAGNLLQGNQSDGSTQFSITLITANTVPTNTVPTVPQVTQEVFDNVLTGTTDWTSGSVVVSGTGTSFTTQVVVGDYLIGPDGFLYTVASVANDTTLTLATAFNGADSTGNATTGMPSSSSIIFSAANGNAISTADTDAFLGSGIVQVTLSLPNLYAGAPIGSFTNATPAGWLSINPAAVAGLVTLTGNGTSTVTFSGLISVVNLALSQVTYTPAVDLFTDVVAGPPTMSLTMLTSDLGNYGTPLGVPQITAISSIPLVVQFVNRAPTLNVIPDQGTVPGDILENTGTAEPVVVPFSGITTGEDDEESVPPLSENFTVTAAITPLAGDALNIITLDGVTYNDGSQDQTGSLQFTPILHQFGTTHITVTITDSSGTANGGVNVFTRTFAITVTPVNDPPVGANNTETINEDRTLVFTAADFGFTDPGDSPPIGTGPGDAFLNVQITALPAPGAGTLRNNGVPVNVDDFVSVADINLGRLVYTPNTDNHNLPAATPFVTFTFKVQDDGGTNFGGVDIDQTNRTFTINVTSINDAPLGANKTVTINEDRAYTFSPADFGYTDPKDNPTTGATGPVNLFQDVIITTLPGPGAGTFRNNGVTVNAGDAISFADINAGRLVFTPSVDRHNLPAATPYVTFTFRVRDDGGVAGFTDDRGNTDTGVNTDPTARTFTINVTSINDFPIGANKTVTINEDRFYTFTPADFGYTDPKDDPALGATGPRNAFQNIVISSLPGPGTGVFANNGVVVTLGQSISFVDINAGLLRFTPTADHHNLPAATPYVTFGFQVQDDGGVASFTDDMGNTDTGVDTDPVVKTFTINVTSINDFPVGTSNTVTINEDRFYTFAPADFGYTDPQDDPALGATGPRNAFLNVIITALPGPGAGTFTNNGVAVTLGQSISFADINAGRLRFTPSTDRHNLPAATPYGTFSFRVQDNGGVASFTDVMGNTDTGVDTDPVAKTMTIHVNSINDFPVGANRSVSINEDGSYTFLTTDFGFTDPRDNPALGATGPINTFLAVVITTLPGPGTGVFANNGVLVTAGQAVSFADIAAGRLRYTPTADRHNLPASTPYVSFTFQVQDNGGVAGFTDDMGNTDTGVNLDPVPKTFVINVASVNDDPVGTSNTQSLNEDRTLTFTVADFGYSDPGDSPPSATGPANNLLAVKITSLPTTGTFTNNGAAVTLNQFIPVADIVAGRLRFTPAAQHFGSPYATFTFRVQDDGGGTDLDVADRTFRINVTSVNDAPVGASKTISLNEDQTLTLNAGDFGFTDPNDTAPTGTGPANTLLAVRITALPANGVLSNNGVAVTVGQSIPVADITGGRLLFTPVADGNGSPYATFSFRVQDNGGVGNASDTRGNSDTGVDLDQTARVITINVISVNDQPDLNAIPAQFILENAGVRTIPLSGIGVGTVNEAGQVLTITATAVSTSGPANLIQNLTVNYNSPNGTGSITYNPLPDFWGTATITVTIQDNGGTATSTDSRGNSDTGVDTRVWTFQITVAQVNKPPRITISGNTSLENSGQQVLPFAVDDGLNEFGQRLTVVAVASANPALISNLQVNFAQNSAPPTTAALLGSITYTPTPDFYGTAIILVTVKDDFGTANGGIDTTVIPVTINVTKVNKAPTINAVANVTILENAAQQTIPLSGISMGLHETGEVLTITAVSNNPAVVPNPTVNYTSPNGTGALVFTPVANAFGTATITVTVRDNGGTANGGFDTRVIQFRANVLQVNNAPSINVIPTQTDFENDGTQTINLTGIGPGLSESQQSVTITAVSSNPALIPNPLVNYTFPNTTGTLTYTPTADVFGTATITVTVKDNGGTSNGGDDTTVLTFVINVTPVNDPPTIDQEGNVTILEDSGLQTVSLSGITDGVIETGQALTVTAVSSVPGLIPNPTVTYTSPNNTAQLSFTPVANAFGTATITVTVQDAGGTSNGGVNTKVMTFNVIVTPINDQPTINAIPDQSVLENPGTQSISLSGIAAGPNEIQQLSIVSITSSNTALIPNVVATYLSPNTVGSLAYTPTDDTFGSSIITVTLRDNGGTLNGGVDTRVLTFRINVAQVNKAPTIDAVPNQTVQQNSGVRGVLLSGISQGFNESGQTVTISATSSNTALIANPTINYTSPGSSGVLVYTPVAGQSGQSTITVTVRDSGGTSNGGDNVTTLTFQINVVQSSGPQVLPGVQLTLTQGLKTTKAGGSASFAIVLATPPISNVTINLSSSDPTQGVVSRQSVTFTPANWNFTQLVTITGVDNGLAEGNKLYTILTAPAVSTDPAYNGINAADVSVINVDTHTARMLRAYNPNADLHVFTTNRAEFDIITANGLNDESTGQPGWGVLTEKTGTALPVYRLYNPNTGEHYYTISAGEKDILVDAGLNFEGNEGFMYPTKVGNSTEIFKLYNTISGAHIYSESPRYRDALLTQFPGIWVINKSLGFGFAFDANNFLTVPLPSLSQSSSSSPVVQAAAMSLESTGVPLTNTFAATSDAASLTGATSGLVASSTSLSTTLVSDVGADADDEEEASTGSGQQSSNNLDDFWSALSHQLSSAPADDDLDSVF